jgi:hypothetical protein
MTVTATFQPASLEATAGVPAILALCVHNDFETEQIVRLKAIGELAQHTVLQSETIYLEPGEEFEVPVLVDIGNALPAGNHASQIEVDTPEQGLLTAEATISVVASSTYSVSLAPARSSSAAAGKHRVTIDNTGNTPIVIELAATSATDNVEIEIAAPLVKIDPGKSAKVELKVHPRERFWNGDGVEHLFDVHVGGSDDAAHLLSGSFTQGPRFRPWFLPAAAGALIALLLGSLAWFAVLQPQVESIADDTDLRLIAEAAPGDTANESFTVASDRVLSVTDIVFQNPDGAVGRVALLRSGKVLLESELANFRDLDLHFVAPFRFDSNDTVEIRVDCQTPGPVNTNCEVSATILGFIDQAD